LRIKPRALEHPWPPQSDKQHAWAGSMPERDCGALPPIGGRDACKSIVSEKLAICSVITFSCEYGFESGAAWQCTLGLGNGSPC